MEFKHVDDQINTETDRKILDGLNWAKMTPIHGGKVMPAKMPRYVDYRAMNKWVSTKVVDACEFIPGYGAKWPVDILRSGSQYYRTTSKGPEYIKPGDFIVRVLGDYYKFVDRDIFLKNHKLAEEDDE
ncbi:hypothetical protein [Lentilactobacillus senioris]|uniref:hypothetical protein n=1 Tax=Lentilactobacillus senioris TaxID=931534 RepID=UPI003D28BA60